MPGFYQYSLIGEGHLFLRGTRGRLLQGLHVYLHLLIIGHDVELLNDNVFTEQADHLRL